MDAEHVRALESFVRLHAHRLPKPDGAQVAYIATYAPSMPINIGLVRYTESDLIREFGTDNLTVRWLLDQLRSADHTRYSVMGLRFGQSTVLAHTLQRGSVLTDDDIDD